MDGELTLYPPLLLNNPIYVSIFEIFPFYVFVSSSHGSIKRMNYVLMIGLANVVLFCRWGKPTSVVATQWVMGAVNSGGYNIGPMALQITGMFFIL